MTRFMQISRLIAQNMLSKSTILLRHSLKILTPFCRSIGRENHYLYNNVARKKKSILVLCLLEHSIFLVTSTKIVDTGPGTFLKRKETVAQNSFWACIKIVNCILIPSHSINPSLWMMKNIYDFIKPQIHDCT